MEQPSATEAFDMEGDDMGPASGPKVLCSVQFPVSAEVRWH